jgi:hypothetical protein
MIVAIRFEEYWIVFAFKIEFVFNFWRYNLDIQNASFIGWLNCLRIWKPYHFVLPLNENWQKCLEIAINGLVLIRFSWIASGFENFDSATISFFTGIEFSWNTIFLECSNKHDCFALKEWEAFFILKFSLFYMFTRIPYTCTNKVVFNFEAKQEWRDLWVWILI